MASFRDDLHRMLLPREEATKQTAAIMWTSTRNDMVTKSWVPNHFALCMPLVASSEEIITQWFSEDVDDITEMAPVLDLLDFDEDAMLEVLM